MMLWLAAAFAPSAPAGGSWSIRYLPAGRSQAEVVLLCLDRADWLRRALPPVVFDGCDDPHDRLPADVACRRDGRLRVTGMVGASGFTLAAERRGRVGINRAATLRVLIEGRRIGDRC